MTFTVIGTIGIESTPTYRDLAGGGRPMKSIDQSNRNES